MGKQHLILIDPGHGGRDSGAAHGGAREADINLAVASILAGKLRAHNHLVAMTRWSDVTRPLKKRIEQEQALQPSLYLSIHCNAALAPEASGIEVWTSPGDTEADPAATVIFMALSRALPKRKLRTDLTDGDPDKEARFAVLFKTKCPAVLVEMGFISNPEERAWLTDPETHELIASALMAGVSYWLDGKAQEGNA